jgi:hypothetical protein
MSMHKGFKAGVGDAVILSLINGEHVVGRIVTFDSDFIHLSGVQCVDRAPLSAVLAGKLDKDDSTAVPSALVSRAQVTKITTWPKAKLPAEELRDQQASA